MWGMGEMGGQFNTEFEQVKRSFVDLASEMRCPHHFQNPTVEMDGESFDDFSVEVITCCDEFQKRVEEALNKLVEQPNLIVAPAVAITPPNPCIKYSHSRSIFTPATTPVTVAVYADSRNDLE